MSMFDNIKSKLEDAKRQAIETSNSLVASTTTEVSNNEKFDISTATREQLQQQVMRYRASMKKLLAAYKDSKQKNEKLTEEIEELKKKGQNTPEESLSEGNKIRLTASTPVLELNKSNNTQTLQSIFSTNNDGFSASPSPSPGLSRKVHSDGIDTLDINDGQKYKEVAKIEARYQNQIQKLLKERSSLEKEVQKLGKVISETEKRTVTIKNRASSLEEENNCLQEIVIDYEAKIAELARENKETKEMICELQKQQQQQQLQLEKQQQQQQQQPQQQQLQQQQREPQQERLQNDLQENTIEKMVTKNDKISVDNSKSRMSSDEGSGEDSEGHSEKYNDHSNDMIKNSLNNDNQSKNCLTPDKTLRKDDIELSTKIEKLREKVKQLELEKNEAWDHSKKQIQITRQRAENIIEDLRTELALFQNDDRIEKSANGVNGQAANECVQSPTSVSYHQHHHQNNQQHVDNYYYENAKHYGSNNGQPQPTMTQHHLHQPQQESPQLLHLDQMNKMRNRELKGIQIQQEELIRRLSEKEQSEYELALKLENMEREMKIYEGRCNRESAHMDYLKNILVSYMDGSNVDKRLQLTKVIMTIMHFNEEEKENVLKNMALQNKAKNTWFG